MNNSFVLLGAQRHSLLPWNLGDSWIGMTKSQKRIYLLRVLGYELRLEELGTPAVALVKGNGWERRVLLLCTVYSCVQK